MYDIVHLSRILPELRMIFIEKKTLLKRESIHVFKLINKTRKTYYHLIIAVFAVKVKNI